MSFSETRPRVPHLNNRALKYIKALYPRLWRRYSVLPLPSLRFQFSFFIIKKRENRKMKRIGLYLSTSIVPSRQYVNHSPGLTLSLFCNTKSACIKKRDNFQYCFGLFLKRSEPIQRARLLLMESNQACLQLSLHHECRTRSCRLHITWRVIFSRFSDWLGSVPDGVVDDFLIWRINLVKTAQNACKALGQ